MILPMFICQLGNLWINGLVFNFLVGHRTSL
jgi:hypothetical protein